MNKDKQLLGPLSQHFLKGTKIGQFPPSHGKRLVHNLLRMRIMKALKGSPCEALGPREICRLINPDWNSKDYVSPQRISMEICKMHRAGLVKRVGHGLYIPNANVSRESGEKGLSNAK